MTDVGSFIFYIFTYLTSAFAFVCSYSNNKTKARIMMLIAVLLPTIIAFVRVNVGTDYATYRTIYAALHSMSLKEEITEWWMNFEQAGPLIWGIAKFANMFRSEHLFFGIMGLFTCIPASAFFRKRLGKQQAFVAWFLFLCIIFTSSLNIARQQIAVSIAIYSLNYVFDKQFGRFLGCVAVAFLFHITAIIIVPTYFIYIIVTDENKTRRTKLEAIMVVVFVLFMANINVIFGLLGGRYIGYATIEAASNKMFFLQCAIFIVLLAFSKRMSNLNKDTNFLLFMYFVALVISFSGFYSPYIKRLAGYYSFASIILASYIPKCFIIKEQSFVKASVCVFEIAVFAISYVVLKQSGVIPFMFADSIFA